MWLQCKSLVEQFRRWFVHYRLVTKQGERLKRVWSSYGLPGVALLSPLLMGAPLGTALALLFGAPARPLLCWIMKQWDKFRHHPATVLAHSTHLKGAGSYDLRTGEECPRVTVTLATGIPEEKCRAHNVGYLDPNEVRPEDWTDHEDEGIAVVPNAGEVLYRIGPKPPEQSAEGLGGR